MDSKKGKPITSSVPSIAIRFNATAEEIEELYMSDGEQNDVVQDINISNAASDVEYSPSKLSKLCKRSTSVDVSNTLDSSPPSDPWRFFSDIKGKITKSVEGKLTEYKTRTADADGSPKTSKGGNNKENSSLSDSEELSESSISRTCGIVSTTEGVEMSSDDETPSLSEKEKKNETGEAAEGLRRRIKLLKGKDTKAEGTVSSNFLENLQNINMGVEAHEKEDVESGVDALLQIDNVEMNESDLLVKFVSGSEMRNDAFASAQQKERTVFAPYGHVDLRPIRKATTSTSHFYSFRIYILLLVFTILYYTLPLSSYIYGFIAGSFGMLGVSIIYIHLYTTPNCTPVKSSRVPILEIPAVEEHQPLTKYEGWANEFPEKYDPQSYHISKTQSVYLRLQGNLLKISHTRSKIPKRAMWNESEHKPAFYKSRIYNLQGAKITLLPTGLTKIRHWSKKYPICITLNKDQLNLNYPANKNKIVAEETASNGEKKGTNGNGDKKKDKNVLPPVDVVVESPKKKRDDKTNVDGDVKDILESAQNLLVADQLETSDADLDNDVDSLGDDGEEDVADDWFTSQTDDDCAQTSIYIFTRTDREKEHWYRRLIAATHKPPSSRSSTENSNSETQSFQEDYIKLISKFLQPAKQNRDDDIPRPLNSETPPDMLWINSLVSRVLFDCTRNESFVAKVKDRIQRKLSSIKLPYFIEELTVTELSLGNTTPTIQKTEKPVMDDCGLWVDLHINYEGHVVIILQTKLNLMKLKQPQMTNADKMLMFKSAMFHSDVDDSAESSSDDESAVSLPSNVSTLPDPVVGGAGASNNKGKRLIRMVDRIAESRIFQAATEYKYIKKAIEGVSNTDLGLKVELKLLEGCLTLNIPSPPSDRVWVGFRPSPKLQLTAHPIVGERNINFLHVTNWIEKKLTKEFQKILVIPNMEDLYIPVMMQLLPK